MKNINIYIQEKQDWWNGKDAQLINKKDLLKFGVEALKQTKLYASDIQNQISQYEDPDELDSAWEDENLQYCKFEDKLAELIADDNKYTGKEGDICDHAWIYVWDFLDELIKLTSK